MKNNTFGKYCLLSVLGLLLATAYPIYMGISVVSDMIRYGTVFADEYPKYIIPYSPIALALLVGVALMPILLKHLKKYALLGGSAVAMVVFFASEFLLENLVTVTRTETGGITQLENWQMLMCYVRPDIAQGRVWTEVNVLMGEYSPAFKLHFYMISVVLILSLLNGFYGFAHMIRAGETRRRRSLIIQSTASVAFLAMCIWACFTAFYRNGDIRVSFRSAILMCVFFVLFGVTTGMYVFSFTLHRGSCLSVWLPSVVASVITAMMYIGEMILLSGHLYRFGEGFLFDGIPGIVLAPVDIAVILASGAVTAILSGILRQREA